MAWLSTDPELAADLVERLGPLRATAWPSNGLAHTLLGDANGRQAGFHYVAQAGACPRIGRVVYVYRDRVVFLADDAVSHLLERAAALADAGLELGTRAGYRSHGKLLISGQTLVGSSATHCPVGSKSKSGQQFSCVVWMHSS